MHLMIYQRRSINLSGISSKMDIRQSVSIDNNRRLARREAELKQRGVLHMNFKFEKQFPPDPMSQ